MRLTALVVLALSLLSGQASADSWDTHHTKQASIQMPEPILDSTMTVMGIRLAGKTSISDGVVFQYYQYFKQSHSEVDHGDVAAAILSKATVPRMAFDEVRFRVGKTRTALRYAEGTVAVGFGYQSVHEVYVFQVRGVMHVLMTETPVDQYYDQTKLRNRFHFSFRSKRYPKLRLDN